MTSSPMVLITVPLCCSVAVRITSMQMAIMRARPLVAQVIEQPGRADDVGKQDGEFDILDHVYSVLASAADPAP